MARNSLGSLIVTLGLDAAQYVTGLTKAEYEAKKFAERIDRGIAAGAKAAGVAFAALGTAGAAAFAAINSAAQRVGDFKDLEEITGASAESLASFAVAAGVAGTEMGALADASVKLTKNLTGVDDESKAAGAALAAIGVNIKEFKALDPAAQMEGIARALGQFEDGAGKTAVAVALLGRSGAQLLPFLKELESQGGRQRILTQQQIEQADAYADAQKRATTELKLFIDAALIQAIPAITDLVKAAKEFVVQLTGMSRESTALAANNGVVTFAEAGARALAFVIDAADGVARAFQLIAVGWAGLIALGREGFLAKSLDGARAVLRAMNEDIDKILNRPTFGSNLERQMEERRRNEARRAIEDRGFRPPGRRIQFEGAEGRGGARRAAMERESEAERYIKQLERTEEQLQELSVAEQVFNDFSLQRIKDAQKGEFERAYAIALRIDATKKAQKAEEDAARAEEERNRAASDRLRQFLQEQDSIRASNEQLQLEIALIGKDEEARRALTTAFEQEAIAREIKNKQMQQEASDSEDEIKNIQTTIDLLRQRSEMLGQRGATFKLADDIQLATQRAQEFNEAIGGPFANALSDAVTGAKSLKDAFNDMTKSIVRNITDIAANDLAEALFGGVGTKKAGGLSGIGAWLAGLFGNSSPIGASGPMPPMLDFNANGTNFARGGWSVVGERGPEVVNLPRGAQVIPHSELQAKRAGRAAPIVINQSFAPGTDRRTVGQAAAAAGKAVRRGMERYA